MQPLTDLEQRVRLVVYRHFVDTANAPDSERLASAVEASEREVVGALRRLSDLHALVLAPASTTIWMAHPFSAVPTAYPVDIGDKTYFANCAWDVAGVLSLVGDGRSRTICEDCGGDLDMVVRGDTITGNGVVHFAVPPRRFWDNVAFT